MQEPIPPQFRTGGGSDDIGDISWNVPTITLRYPANIPRPAPATPGRDAIAMATPIAHKGEHVRRQGAGDERPGPAAAPGAGARGLAVLRGGADRRPAATRSFLRGSDRPAIHLNRERMEKWRPEMRKYYYDPSRYETYLEQLGIDYPTVRR